MAPAQSRFSPESVQAFRIAGVYALIGSLWMLLSSGIVALFMSRAVSLRDLPWNGVVSGMLVVLSSSFLLYLLVKKTLDDAHRAQQALKLRTVSGIRPATSCSRSYPSACNRVFATPTPWPVWAVTNSFC